LRRSTEILELTLRGHQIEELAAWLGRVVLAHPGNLPDRMALGYVGSTHRLQ